MDSFTRREKGLLFFLLSVIIVGSILTLNNKKASYEFDEEIGSDLEADILSEEIFKDDLLVDKEEEDRVIYVHISGQVKNPGLLELKEGDRLVDAIELSGGPCEEADLELVNLARILSDEEKIYIPKIGQDLDSIDFIDSNKKKSKLDINRCEKEDLETLPGIGAKTAEKILNYREKEKFNSIEDIKKVPGIGEKKFKELEDFIIVR